jgi:hypothetical protein
MCTLVLVFTGMMLMLAESCQGDCCKNVVEGKTEACSLKLKICAPQGCM